MFNCIVFLLYTNVKAPGNEKKLNMLRLHRLGTKIILHDFAKATAYMRLVIQISAVNI